MKKAKILIVEDNLIVAEDIKNKLIHMGYHVTAIASNGKEALLAAETELPDIALMDIRLGGQMNGIDVAVALKQTLKVPVIYLTAYADNATISRAKITEPYGYIIKPFDENELKSTIEIALFKQDSDRKIRENQQWLKTILTSIGDGVIATDNAGWVVFMNPVAELLTGWKEGEAVGKSIHEVFRIVDEETLKEVENPVDRVLRENLIVGLANHTLLLAKDGRRIPIADSGAPIQSGDGKKLGVVLVFRDQTQDRTLEKALRDSESKFRDLFNKANDAICLHTIDSAGKPGKFLEVNEIACNMLGYSRDEYRSMTPYDILSDEMAQLYAALMPELLENGYLTFEMKHLAKNGSEVPVETNSHLFDSEGGKRVLSISRDLTERKTSEIELKKLGEAIQQALEGILITEPDGAITYANPAFETITGYSLIEVIGHPPDALTGKKQTDRLYTEIWETILDGKRFTGRISNKRKSGHPFTVECSITPVKSKSGQIENFVWIIRDISDEIRYEEMLKQSQKMEAIATLAGGIAHDFNNMLGIIMGNVSYALLRLNPIEELFEVLQDVQKGAKQAQKLTQQLLTFSKGGAPIKKVFNINHLIEESANLVLRGTKAQCVFKFEEEIWESEIDEGQIHQVICNLLINATQAMPEGGEIILQTKNRTHKTDNRYILPSGDYVMITVRDQGLGIPAKHLSNIFDPFYTTKQKGSGLGLSTAYSIIKKHHGHISAASTLGEGTVFTIFLPASREGGEQDDTIETGDHYGHGRILVMDDQDHILRMLNRILDLMQYETVTASDGQEAIRKYLEAFKAGTPFDLVILDLTIPGGMGGVLTMAELRKIDPNVKAVVSSGYSNDPVMAHYSDYGFCGVVPKPYTKTQLANLLNRIFNPKS